MMSGSSLRAAVAVAVLAVASAVYYLPGVAPYAFQQFEPVRQSGFCLRFAVWKGKGGLI